jgi:hypothetical protein
MINMHFILLLVAFIFFVLAAVGVPSRINWIGAGLALWVLSLLIA